MNERQAAMMRRAAELLDRMSKVRRLLKAIKEERRRNEQNK